jgi:hypothetical protein
MTAHLAVLMPEIFLSQKLMRERSLYGSNNVYVGRLSSQEEFAITVGSITLGEDWMALQNLRPLLVWFF